MYISGPNWTFESRLHQLATDLATLISFIKEGNTYYSSETVHVQNKWERECRLCKFRLTQDPSDLTIQLLNNAFIYDENGSAILDENDDLLLEETL